MTILAMTPDLLCKIWLFLGLLMAHTLASQRDSIARTEDIMVVESGLFPVEVDSVALVFYLTVVNKGKRGYTIKSTVDKCCLRVDKEAKDFDCESMSLMVDLPVLLNPQEKHNLTLVFANLFSTDRVGECVIDLEYIKDKTVQHTLKFDTSLPSSPRYCYWVPPTLRAYLFGVTVADCESIDQDRLHNCRPVDCVLKYNGHRNFFNKTTKTCDIVPKCSHRNDKGLPLQAYNADKNKCDDLDLSLTREDFAHFAAAESPARNRIPGSDKYTYQVSDTQVKCVHGIIAEGRCVCSEGWHSRYMDPASVPMEQMTQLCDIPAEGYHFYAWGLHWDIMADFIMTLVGAIITLTVTLTLLSVYEYYIRRSGGGFKKKEELGDLKKEITSTSAEFTAGDDEINTSDPFEAIYADVGNQNAIKTEISNNNDHSKYIKGYAVALMNHFPSKETELSLRVGDVINDLRHTEKEGVLEGTCHGVVGQFPDFCVNVHEASETKE